MPAMIRCMFCLLAAILLWGPIDAQDQGAEKPRTIVTTDGEVDDVDSFIRMLLYANEFKLEGLVYSSSQWHYKGDGKGTAFTSEMENTAERYGERTALRWPGTTWMQDLLNEYEKVRPNLSLHAEGYPTADALRELVKVGNINFEGDMAEPTEGSEWIKDVLLDDDPQPVYLQVWGGTNTIARALKSIEEEYKGKANWQAIYDKVSEKAIIYTVLDQDATYRKYVGPNWPDIRVFYNANQFWCFAYPWTRVVPEPLQKFMRGPFMKEHIVKGHGPLLEQYYTWGDGRQIRNDPEHNQGDTEVMERFNMTPYDFISEGDSPAYFQLLDVGLMNRDNPAWGGWGGRMVPSASNPRRWEDGEHVTDFNPFTQKPDASYPQTRWIEALQLDFAARADWCVKPFEAANHPPRIGVEGEVLRDVMPGETLTLTATSEDPDGDPVSFSFWQYIEAGIGEMQVSIHRSGEGQARIGIPEAAKKGASFHLIVEGRDGGSPELIRYQRVILRVR